MIAVLLERRMLTIERNQRTASDSASDRLEMNISPSIGWSSSLSVIGDQVSGPLLVVLLRVETVTDIGVSCERRGPS